MNASFWVLLLALQSIAVVIHVPEDQPTVQLGLDATASGDTVLVARGIYQELLESPAHSFTLCSNFIYTEDSTDIVETVLDGNHEGTVLHIELDDGHSATVGGFTIQRGLGQTGENIYDLSAGGVNFHVDLGEERVVDLEVSDTIFKDNHSEHGGCNLYVGGHTGQAIYGRLIMSRLHFVGNDDPEDAFHESIVLATRSSPEVRLEDWVFDAGTSQNDLLGAYSRNADTLIVRNITLLDGNGGVFDFNTTCQYGQAPLYENIRSINTGALKGSMIDLSANSLEENHSATCYIRNIEVKGVLPDLERVGLRIVGGEDGPRLDIDGLEVQYVRGGRALSVGTPLHGTLRNVHVHHNTVGDSSMTDGYSTYNKVMAASGVSIYDAHIHDNAMIIPPHPDIGEHPGNRVDGAILSTRGPYVYESQHFERITLENNTVIDLDDYSNLFPNNFYEENHNREFDFSIVSEDTTYFKDIVIRNSRQPNHCPEIYDPGSFDYCGPGWTMGQYARHLVAENILLENCDDGGFSTQGDYVSLDNVVIRNVERSGLWMGWGRARNVLIDGTVAKDNWLHLTPGYDYLSLQAALVIHGGNSYEFENLTITNCDSLHHLFAMRWDSAIESLVFRNAIISGNQYEHMSEVIDPDEITWENCFVQEAVAGEGNIIGQDPMFDSELGPPFLSPDSPCVDAGNPESVYNDVEDADNPGWARWPSQGGLRNDMGFFGGPGVDSLAVDWLPVKAQSPVTQPKSFVLGDPYPNPFNPVCRIPFTLERPSKVTLRLYNMAGQLVKKQGTSLFGETRYSAGRHELLLDGGRLPSGVYIAEVRAGSLREVVKVLLVR